MRAIGAGIAKVTRTTVRLGVAVTVPVTVPATLRRIGLRAFVVALALVLLGLGGHLVSIWDLSFSFAQPAAANGTPAAAAPACSPDWQVVSSPNEGLSGLTSVLRGVAALSATDAWAVGFYGSQGLTEHWDGVSWNFVPSPAQVQVLWSVAAVSASDVWAVGSGGIEHWDGSFWSVVPSTSGVFYSVAAVSADDVWAVGIYSAHTLVEHWDGTAWSLVSSPSPGTQTNVLRSVAAGAANDVWAVGYYQSYSGSSYIEQTLVEHWDGMSWSVVPSPSSNTSESRLFGVAPVSASDVWAAGFTNSGTLTEHWDGSQWSIVSGPTTGGYSGLFSLVAVASNDVWAVGSYAPVGALHTLVEHWDGTQWSIVSSPNRGTGENELDSVAAIASNDLWAVGFSGGGAATLAEHWDGSQWSVVPTPSPGTTDNSLASVSAVSPSDVWAVGHYYDGVAQQPLVEHWDGTAWHIITGPSPGHNSYLQSVAAIASNDVWAVGYSDASGVYQTLAEHWNGSAWSIVSSPSPSASDSALWSAAAAASNDVWAVGSYSNGSSVYQTLTEHWDGSAWSVVSSPNLGTGENRLRSVAVVSSNDVWATGYYLDGVAGTDQTLMEHWDGTQWSIISSPDQGPSVNQLYSVAAVSSNDVWAVGTYVTDGLADQTLVEHWDGSVWSIVSSPGPGSSVNELYSVTAVSTDDVWAVGSYSDGSGYQTLVEHWDGTAWNIAAAANPNTNNQLWSVAAVSANDVWAVGFDYSGSSPYQTLAERYNPCPSTATPTATTTPTDTPAPSTDTPTATDTPAPPTVTPAITLTPIPPAATPTPAQPTQGCAPAFWQGNTGVYLWDQAGDPDWIAHGGAGTNPYQTTTRFNNFFTHYRGFGNMTMLDILGAGGRNDAARRAARDVVAGYLNASFGMNYPYSGSQIASMWTDAVNTNSFGNLYSLLDAANSQQCPIQ